MLTMGGKNNAKVSTEGMENEYVFRDRVIRDKRYKLYLAASPDRGFEKLIDLQNDPEEIVNLLNSSEPQAQAARARLSAVVSKFPERDGDPVYSLRPTNSWDVPISVKSQSWKK